MYVWYTSNSAGCACDTDDDVDVVSQDDGKRCKERLKIVLVDTSYEDRMLGARQREKQEGKECRSL